MANAGPAFNQSLVGAILSRRFRLTQELGRGGMGAVYSATPVEGGAPVAIKILHTVYLDDENVRVRFLEEGRTCIRLVHRNILRMHEVQTAEDGSPYLVMDLLDGVPLSAYTKNGGRIAVAHAVPILQGILSGLGAAHAEAIVHRDLKPGNVFLARDEAGVYVVKILDFGIAKVMDVAGGMGNRTRTGMLLGTPAYMSPEQITSAKDVDARSDLWSAGVMFYEMLTGRTAFPAPTEYARLSAVLQTEPDPIERIDPQLAPMAPFLARALRKDRAQRFQTAAEMAHALERASTGQEPSNSRISFMPLSRLPDRPWITAPTGTTPADVSIVSTDPAAPPTPIMIDEAATRVDLLPQSPGGTLASTPGSPVTPAPKINVVVVKPAEPKGTSSTLTSQESRAPKKRSIVLGWVVVFVAVALTAGICVGFLLGRAY
jgi:eukaryotic-like serine/threonine-protein kinase